jgi:hypothetical protein
MPTDAADATISSVGAADLYDKTMRIPIFVSCPSDRNLDPAQRAVRGAIVRFLYHFNLESRALGRSDYPTSLPLREVMIIARHCAGGIVLGFEQFKATAGVWRSRQPPDNQLGAGGNGSVRVFPTEWNNLEAGIMFGLGLPILIFRERITEAGRSCRVEGGIFDNGVTDAFVHDMPTANVTPETDHDLKQMFLKWHGRVSAHYYGVPSPV